LAYHYLVLADVFRPFWSWYERNYRFNLAVAAILFSWQLVHLFWLTTDVLAAKLAGTSFFPVGENWQVILALVDYTEIPAILATSILYIDEYRQKRNLKALLYLAFLNIQWIHLFWLTDEIVVANLTGETSVLFPAPLIVFAILIDYLELPVIWETIRKFIGTLRSED
jgi:hypothetical protein